MTIKTAQDIRAIREARGITQESLAEMAGLSQRSVRRAENGEAVSMETLKCIAAALDVTLEMRPAGEGAEDAPKQEDKATGLDHLGTAKGAALVIGALTMAWVVIGSRDPLETAGNIVMGGFFIWVLVSLIFGSAPHERMIAAIEGPEAHEARLARERAMGPSIYESSPRALRIAMVALLSLGAMAIAGSAAYAVLTKLSFLDGVTWINADKSTVAAMLVLIETAGIVTLLLAFHAVTRPSPPPKGWGEKAETSTAGR